MSNQLCKKRGTRTDELMKDSAKNLNAILRGWWPDQVLMVTHHARHNMKLMLQKSMSTESKRLLVDRLIMEVGAVIRDQGVQECSSEALLFLSEIARREALRIIEIAKRKALYAGRATVNEKDACKAVVEALESFAPPNNLTFQTTEQALAKDINSFPLGEFPSNFVGLPLPPDDISFAQWRFSNQHE